MQASAAALWINTVFAGFDQSITTAVHNLYLWAGDFFTPFFEFISFLGHDGIILVLLSPPFRYGHALRRRHRGNIHELHP